LAAGVQGGGTPGGELRGPEPGGGSVLSDVEDGPAGPDREGANLAQRHDLAVLTRPEVHGRDTVLTGGHRRPRWRARARRDRRGGRPCRSAAASTRSFNPTETAQPCVLRGPVSDQTS